MLDCEDREDQAMRLVRLALDVDLRLGARLAGAVEYRFQEKTINLVTEIEVTQLLKIELLGVTRSDKAVPYLLPFLSHEDFENRYTVAQAFGRIGSNSVVSALLPNLHHQNPSVRLATIKSLEKIPSEISVLELIAALQEPFADIRRSAAGALGTIASHIAVDALLETLNDQDSSVRREAATSLGKIGGSKALLGLINLLRDRGFHVAVTAAYAIAELDTSDVNEVDIVKAIDELTKFALKTDDNQFLIATILALKELNFGAVPNLILLNIDNEHPLVRSNVAYALGELGDQEVVPILLNLLIDENNLVKVKAVSALGKLSASEVTSKLLNIFSNEKDVYVRACIVSTLGKLHTKESVDLLINALEEPESQVRGNAAYALGKIHTNDAIQGILIALKHKDVSVRRNAITAIKLGKLNNDIFVQAISNMLNDEDEWVRAHTCEALGVIGDKSDITNILAALQDPIPTVRRGAIRALREMGIDTKEVVEKLSSLLTDTDIHVRRDASYAFRETASPKYLNDLFELQQSTGEIHLFRTITAIQDRCKYYDYNIAQTPLQETENNADPVEYTLNELTKAVKKMSDAPKYDLLGAKIGKLIDTIGVYNENNFAPEQKQNLADAAKEIQDLLEQLAKNYPHATEVEAKDIVKATFEEIKTKHPDKWKILWTQILNPERWLNGGKAAISEIAKHYAEKAENSVFLKAGIAFLDGFSADEE